MGIWLRGRPLDGHQRARAVATRRELAACHSQVTSGRSADPLAFGTRFTKNLRESGGTCRTKSNAYHKLGARRLRRLKATSGWRCSRHPGLSPLPWQGLPLPPRLPVAAFSPHGAPYTLPSSLSRGLRLASCDRVAQGVRVAGFVHHWTVRRILLEFPQLVSGVLTPCSEHPSQCSCVVVWIVVP